MYSIDFLFAPYLSVQPYIDINVNLSTEVIVVMLGTMAMVVPMVMRVPAPLRLRYPQDRPWPSHCNYMLKNDMIREVMGVRTRGIGIGIVVSMGPVGTGGVMGVRGLVDMTGIWR